MELSTNLVCPCNGKLYKFAQSLKAHTKTQGHCTWEQNREQNVEQNNDNDTAAKIIRLEKENEHLKQLIILLIECMSEMELHRERQRQRAHAANVANNNSDV
jgi:hypothetical protein